MWTDSRLQPVAIDLPVLCHRTSMAAANYSPFGISVILSDISLNFICLCHTIAIQLKLAVQ